MGHHRFVVYWWPHLNQQPITGIESTTPFLGSMGLAPKLSNFALLEFSGMNSSNSSILQTLKTKGTTPSLSFGYFAGASYSRQIYVSSVPKLTQFKGNASSSLIIGGYDASRSLMAPLSQNFSHDVSQLLTLPLSSLVVSNALDGKSSPLTTQIQATINSTSPFLVLPKSICTDLSSSFGLSLDQATGLYLVKSTTHSLLQTLNTSLTFGFGNATKGIDITLQYASLDLNASSPFYTEPTRYFPLRASDNDSAAVLGRAFLQET
jgi:hypothetical protein